MAGENNQIQPLGEKEVARILQRAAALQEQDRQRGSLSAEGGRGVSLGELKQIAGEVGIEPGYVEAAAAELQTSPQGRGRFWLWGAPVSSEFEQTVEGEAPVEAWEALVAKIRRATGNVGQVSTLGQALEWTSKRDHVSVSPREGRTTIRIFSRHVLTTSLAYATALNVTWFAFALIMPWLHGLPLEAAGLTAATGCGTFGLARVWARAMFRRHRDRMQGLLQELAEDVAQTAAQSSSAALPSASSPARVSQEPPPVASEAQARVS